MDRNLHWYHAIPCDSMALVVAIWCNEVIKTLQMIIYLNRCPEILYFVRFTVLVRRVDEHSRLLFAMLDFWQNEVNAVL